MNCGCEAPHIGPSLATTCYGGSFIFFMSLIDNLIQNTCDISEICQRVTPKLQPDTAYDFIVIGGGSAGALVASRLSEDPKWKVLLIEAGGDEPPGSQVPSMYKNFHNSILNWNFEIEPQKKACLGKVNRSGTWSAGKALGGTGVINGMMYTRGVAKDYDKWEQMGNPGWSYEKILKYFKKSEGNKEIQSLVSGKVHGSEGPIDIARFPYRPELVDDMVKAAKEVGYSVVDDINEKPYTGFAITQMFQRNGTRVSSARAFLRPARHRSNLHIMMNSTATKIFITKTVSVIVNATIGEQLKTKRGQHKRATQVEFLYKNKTFRVHSTKEIILSAGTVNSPKILLLSGVGPTDELKKVKIKQVHNLPGVGRNLQNHIAFLNTFRLQYVQATNDLDRLVLDNYLKFRNGPMSSAGIAQITARLTTRYGDPSGDNPDLQFFFDGYLANCSRCGEVRESSISCNCNASKIITIAAVNLHPKSRGYIGLKTNNAFDPPLIQPKYFSNSDDVNTIIEGIRHVQKLSRTKILKEKYGFERVHDKYGNCSKKFQYDSDDFWKCAIKYDTLLENHQVGSCKMGPPSDSLAVVNSRLQVHGIERLRVIDASIIPLIISGNLQSTVFMIAEKGADDIKSKWSE